MSNTAYKAEFTAGQGEGWASWLIAPAAMFLRTLPDMKLSYYPGCTMKSHAANFEASLLYSMQHLGVEVQEIERWNCCGTVSSLVQDNAMGQVRTDPKSASGPGGQRLARHDRMLDVLQYAEARQRSRQGRSRPAGQHERLHERRAGRLQRARSRSFILCRSSAS